jgi:hypothetical protein
LERWPKERSSTHEDHSVELRTIILLAAVVACSSVAAVWSFEVFPIGTMSRQAAIRHALNDQPRCPKCTSRAIQDQLVHCSSANAADRSHTCFNRTGWFWLITLDNNETVWIDARSGSEEWMDPTPHSGT